MMTIRRSDERGHFDHGWLDTYHTFSFGDYVDPAWRHFRTLRVINEDVVQPGQGFGTHPHRDMEIITYVIRGSIEHRDSMGNGTIIPAGEVQRMTAGTGITHSEFNPSTTDPLHLMQIWITPARKGLSPSYEQQRINVADEPNRWHVIASPDGRDGSLTVHQDVVLYGAALQAGHSRVYNLPTDRGAWLQVVRGDVIVGEYDLTDGDGAAFEDEPSVVVSAAADAELLLFDLA